MAREIKLSIQTTANLNKLNETIKAAEKLKSTILGVSQAMTRSQGRSGQISRNLQEAADAYGKLGKAARTAAENVDQAESQTKQSARSADNLVDKLVQVARANTTSARATGQNADALNKLEAMVKQTRQAFGGLAREVDKQGDEVSRSLKDQATAFNKLEKAKQSEAEASRDLERAEARLNEVMKKGNVSDMERSRLLEDVESSMKRYRSAQTQVTAANDSFIRSQHRANDAQLEMVRLRKQAESAYVMATVKGVPTDKFQGNYDSVLHRIASLLPATTSAQRLNTAAMADAVQMSTRLAAGEQQAISVRARFVSVTEKLRNESRQTAANMQFLLKAASGLNQMFQRLMSVAQHLAAALTSKLTSGLDRARQAVGRLTDSAGSVFSRMRNTMDAAGGSALRFGKDVSKGMGTAQKSINEMYAAGFSLIMSGQMMGSTGRGILGRLTGQLDQFLDYEKAANRVSISGRIGSNLSADQLSGMGLSQGEYGQQLIDQMVFGIQRGLFGGSPVYGMDATSIAQGAYYYTSALGQQITPQNIGDIANALAPILQVANFTGSSPETTVKGVLNAVMEFGIDPREKDAQGGLQNADEIGQVGKLYAFLANASTMEVPDITEFFKMVGPLAGLMTNSGDPMDAIKEVMGFSFMASEYGLRGGGPGRGLAQLLTSLLDPTDKMEGVSQDLWGTDVKSTFLENGKLKGGMQGLVEPFLKLTEEQWLEAQAALFTNNASRAIIPFIDQIRKDPNKFKDIIAQLDSEGPEKLMSEAILKTNDTVSGNLQNMQNAWFALETMIVRSIQGPLKQGLKMFADLFWEISDVINDNPIIGKLLTGLTTLLGVVLSVVGGLLTFSGGIMILARAFTMMHGAIAPVLTLGMAFLHVLAIGIPILLALGAAAVLLKAAWDRNLFGVQDRFNSFLTFLKGINYVQILEGLPAAAEIMLDRYVALVESFIPKIQKQWARMVAFDARTGALDQFASFARNFAQGFGTGIAAAIGGAVAVMQKLVGVLAKLPQGARYIKDLAEGFLELDLNAQNLGRTLGVIAGLAVGAKLLTFVPQVSTAIGLVKGLGLSFIELGIHVAGSIIQMVLLGAKVAVMTVAMLAQLSIMALLTAAKLADNALDGISAVMKAANAASTAALSAAYTMLAVAIAAATIVAVAFIAAIAAVIALVAVIVGVLMVAVGVFGLLAAGMIVAAFWTDGLSGGLQAITDVARGFWSVMQPIVLMLAGLALGLGQIVAQFAGAQVAMSDAEQIGRALGAALAGLVGVGVAGLLLLAGAAIVAAVGLKFFWDGLRNLLQLDSDFGDFLLGAQALVEDFLVVLQGLGSDGAKALLRAKLYELFSSVTESLLIDVAALGITLVDTFMKPWTMVPGKILDLAGIDSLPSQEDILLDMGVTTITPAITMLRDRQNALRSEYDQIVADAQAVVTGKQVLVDLPITLNPWGDNGGSSAVKSSKDLMDDLLSGIVGEGEGASGAATAVKKWLGPLFDALPIETQKLLTETQNKIAAQTKASQGLVDIPILGGILAGPIGATQTVPTPEVDEAAQQQVLDSVRQFNQDLYTAMSQVDLQTAMKVGYSLEMGPGATSGAEVLAMFQEQIEGALPEGSWGNIYEAIMDSTLRGTNLAGKNIHTALSNDPGLQRFAAETGMSIDEALKDIPKFVHDEALVPIAFNDIATAMDQAGRDMYEKLDHLPIADDLGTIGIKWLELSQYAISQATAGKSWNLSQYLVDAYGMTIQEAEAFLSANGVDPNLVSDALFPDVKLMALSGGGKFNVITQEWWEWLQQATTDGADKTIEITEQAFAALPDAIKMGLTGMGYAFVVGGTQTAAQAAASAELIVKSFRDAYGVDGRGGFHKIAEDAETGMVTLRRSFDGKEITVPAIEWEAYGASAQALKDFNNNLKLQAWFEDFKKTAEDAPIIGGRIVAALQGEDGKVEFTPEMFGLPTPTDGETFGSEFGASWAGGLASAISAQTGTIQSEATNAATTFTTEFQTALTTGLQTAFNQLGGLNTAGLDGVMRLAAINAADAFATTLAEQLAKKLPTAMSGVSDASATNPDNIPNAYATTDTSGVSQTVKIKVLVDADGFNSWATAMEGVTVANVKLKILVDDTGFNAWAIAMNGVTVSSVKLKLLVDDAGFNTWATAMEGVTVANVKFFILADVESFNTWTAEAEGMTVANVKIAVAQDSTAFDNAVTAIDGTTVAYAKIALSADQSAFWETVGLISGTTVATAWIGLSANMTGFNSTISTINGQTVGTTYIDVVSRQVGEEKKASGGLIRGAMTMVGEYGPELVSLPRNSRVFSHGQTLGMLQSTFNTPVDDATFNRNGHAMPISERPTGSSSGGGSVIVQVDVGQLVVREEADIYKLAKQVAKEIGRKTDLVVNRGQGPSAYN